MYSECGVVMNTQRNAFRSSTQRFTQANIILFNYKCKQSKVTKRKYNAKKHMEILRTQTLINISILTTDLILLTNEAMPSVNAIHVIFLRQYINDDIDQNTLKEIWIAIPRSNIICISSTYKCMCFYTCEMNGNMGMTMMRCWLEWLVLVYITARLWRDTEQQLAAKLARHTNALVVANTNRNNQRPCIDEIHIKYKYWCFKLVNISGA